MREKLLDWLGIVRDPRTIALLLGLLMLTIATESVSAYGAFRGP